MFDQATIEKEKSQHLFQVLEEHYGWFDWWPTDNAFEIMMGAILVQNTNWRNAEKALEQLGRGITPSKIEAMEQDELAQKIRSSGYYNQKANKLKSLVKWFKKYDYDIERVRENGLGHLRKELLAVKGIGGETADVILTYAIGKPSFVIDAYARRIASRYGIEVPKSYENFRNLMQQAFPNSKDKYGYYHGLMVEHGGRYCNPKPKCDECPIAQHCQQNIE